MVLDEAASTTPETIRDDSSPASPDDASGGAVLSNSPFFPADFKLDLSQYPQPVPIIAPLVGYTNTRIANTVLASMVEISRVVRRPLTTPECDAIAFHTANGLAIASYGMPIGIAAGAWRSRNTRATFKFPFYRPDLTKFNPEQFGPMRGPPAVAAWHATRMGAYVFMGTIFARILVGFYAATVAASGERKDSRLKDIVAAIHEIGVEGARKRKMEGTYPAHGQAAPAGGGKGEPSPMAAGYGGQQDGYGSAVSGAMNTGVMDDQQARIATQQKPQSGDGYAPGQSGAFESDRSAEQRQTRSFEFDDASPTAMNEQADSQQSGGSAWDRLRRGGSPQQQPANRTSQQPPTGNAWARTRAQTRPQDDNASPVSDEYAPSSNSSEDERRRAREQAQREFDAKLERERMGENFDDSGKRWS